MIQRKPVFITHVLYTKTTILRYLFNDFTGIIHLFIIGRDHLEVVTYSHDAYDHSLVMISYSTFSNLSSPLFTC